jgi:multidrug resistance protein, MATE family
MKLAVDTTLARRILALAWPVVLAMLSQTAINQVDHILIGRLPAAESVPAHSALELALILLWAVGGSLSAISVGTQALTARRFGEGDHARAGGVLTNSLLVAVVTSVVASVAGWFAAPYLFRKFNTNPDVLRLGVPYLQWRLLGVFSMVTTIAFKSWFDGLGKTRVHMYASITMNVINLVLNIALIFGKWGFPAWGVTGSAIASMISSYIGLLLMVVWSFLPDYRGYHHFRLANLSLRQQWDLIKLSVPSGIATLFVMSGFGLFSKIVSLLDLAHPERGPIYGAATNNIIIILMLFFTACIAYGSATATLVGQSMARKEYDLAARYAWEAVKVGVYFTIVIGGIIVLMPDLVLRIYSKDSEVIAVARPLLRISGALLPFVLASLVLTQALFGAGNTRFVMFVEFGLHFFCLVPLAYLGGMVFGWGVLGVWSGAYIYILLLCGIMAWKFAEGRWREIRI